MDWWDPNTQQTFFIYGGKWMAQYESPSGLQDSGLYGASTNQHMVNGSGRIDLEVDDHIFLRPTQSEFVFLQFGDLLAVRKGRIVDQWPVLTE
jgi:D-serine deaminase-like pyridoxal phosphate-dependent protein